MCRRGNPQILAGTPESGGGTPTVKKSPPRTYSVERRGGLLLTQLGTTLGTIAALRELEETGEDVEEV